jgi:MoaA/NifB/PqqE/SkfB family radical SAM enzyme
VSQYRRIIDEIKGKSTAVSLYWLGDPLMHPDLDEMCQIAHEAKLNVHISTNFSFSLKDERIRRMVKSGLTHLTVCVDGLSQEKYQRTRVGGRIARVLSNLERVCQFRREYDQAYPKVEVQYIKFQHNLDEFEKAKRLFHSIGVDQVTAFWGYLHNYTDLDPGTYTVHSPKKKKLVPGCFWPYFSMTIKYNGDVVPCCDYRIGSAYANTGDPRVLGNVFETSIREIWNSSQYRASRRLVSNPQLIESEKWLKKNFCYGCRKIFETDVEKNLRFGSHYRFEELYTIGEKGTPVRILESEI